MLARRLAALLLPLLALPASLFAGELPANPPAELAQRFADQVALLARRNGAGTVRILQLTAAPELAGAPALQAIGAELETAAYGATLVADEADLVVSAELSRLRGRVVLGGEARPRQK